MEKEITEAIDIADARGNLQRDAIGWARHPLLRSTLGRGISRVAKWNYWCITSREGALTVLVADVGYAAFAQVSFLEYSVPGQTEHVYVRPFGFATPLPDGPRGEIVIDTRAFKLALRDEGAALHITADVRTLLAKNMTVDLVVERPLTHETLNALIPWDDTRFQLTSKQQALPARGVVRVGTREHHFSADNTSFACLDFGRGRWPKQIDWNWGFASGTAGTRTIGFNLGGKWTDNTGVTENAIVIDGRLHKISDDVDFTYGAYMDPWHIRTRASERVALRFDPMRERKIKVPLGLASVELHQMMGHYSGVVYDDAGERVEIADVIGLAESFRGRWPSFA